MTLECVANCANRLGESAVWDWRSGRFVWVDIENAILFELDEAAGDLIRHPMPERIGAVGLRQGGGFVLALASGFATFDPASGAIERIGQISLPPDCRLNDGRVDHQGRFWAGAMSEVDRFDAPLFRLDPDHTIHRMREGIGCSNSISFSPGGEHMYFVDTRRGEIERYDLAPDGAIGPPRPFVRSPENPDGSTVDALGCLWNAVWNDWSIRTYAQTGEMIGRLELPVQRPTSCAFGGPDLNRLYITSAIWDLTPEELEQQPLAGSVLAINLAVSGLPEPEFRG